MPTTPPPPPPPIYPPQELQALFSRDVYFLALIKTHDTSEAAVRKRDWCTSRTHYTITPFDKYFHVLTYNYRICRIAKKSIQVIEILQQRVERIVSSLFTNSIMLSGRLFVSISQELRGVKQKWEKLSCYKEL